MKAYFKNLLMENKILPTYEVVVRCDTNNLNSSDKFTKLSACLVHAQYTKGISVVFAQVHILL